MVEYGQAAGRCQWGAQGGPSQEPGSPSQRREDSGRTQASLTYSLDSGCGPGVERITVSAKCLTRSAFSLIGPI